MVPSRHAAAASTIAVHQSLANHDPDVDAVYRMTRELPIYFQRRGAKVLPPRGTFVPWNAQAVFVSAPAFFGLLLPITVPGRVSDIWRSYLVTRLLWETNYRVAFTSAMLTFPFGFFRSSPQEVTNELFGSAPFDFTARWSNPSLVLNLTIFIVCKFVFTTIAVGCPISCGVFTPVFLIGAAFGRFAAGAVHGQAGGARPAGRARRRSVAAVDDRTRRGASRRTGAGGDAAG